jgi:hypothetical protein
MTFEKVEPLQSGDSDSTVPRSRGWGAGRLSHRWGLEPIVSQTSEIQLNESAPTKHSQTIREVVNRIV